MDPKMIADQLRNDIETAVLMPGTVLKQERLAAQFNVSRQPVRQALDRLLAAGLVDRRSDRSVAVVGLSDVDARELLEVRVLLEARALRASLPLLDAASLRRARRVSDEILEEDDPALLEELDVAFHQLLYSRCANGRLLRMIEDLRREGRRTYARQPGGAARRLELHAEHQAILAACSIGDAEAAIAALSKHLQGVRVDLIQQRGRAE